MTDNELVQRETCIPLDQYPAAIRGLVVSLCKASMGELLVIAEQVEALDAKKGAMLRQVWERRRDAAALRRIQSMAGGQ